MPHHHHPDRGVPTQPPRPPPSPPPKPNPKLLSLILKVIIMTFITSFFFLLLGLAALILLPLIVATHHHHENSRQNQHRQPNSLNGLSTKELKNLPLFRYAKGKNITADDCVVCLDGYKAGQRCRKLEACGHVFHRRCVDSWLVKVAACPVCRTPVGVDLAETLDREFWVFGRRSNPFRVW